MTLTAGRRFFLFPLFFTLIFSMVFGSNINGNVLVKNGSAAQECGVQGYQTPPINHFYSLIFEIFTEIIKFLDRDSCLQLRSCSKHLLIEYTATSNNLFLSHLRPTISSGLNCFSDNRLCATLLLPFAKDLKILLSSEESVALLTRCSLNKALAASAKTELNDLIIEIDTIDSFEAFLKLSICIYHRAIPFLGWKLTETALRLNLLVFLDVLILSDYNYSHLFFLSCRLNLSFIRTHLLKFETNKLNLVHGCNVCIQYNNLNGLKQILQTAIEFNYFCSDNSSIINLIEMSLMRHKFEAVNLFIEAIPSLAQVTSRFIFRAIQTQNLEALTFIAKYYRDSVALVDRDGMSAFEFAAQSDYWIGLEVLMPYIPSPSAESYYNAIYVAVISDSIRSLQLLIKEMDRIWVFRDVIDRITIRRLIIQALERKNSSSLSAILEASPKDILYVNTESGSASYSNERAHELFFDPIRRAIELDFLEGFKCLIYYGGVDLIGRKDFLGRTPFLQAALEGNVAISRYIARIDPVQVHSVDRDGNNALHLAFIYLVKPMTFANKIRNLNVDWEQFNNDGVSPLDICLDRSSLDADDLDLLNQLIHDFLNTKNKS